MIRADWTPLWAADACTGTALGGKQLACLVLLRDRGPMTRTRLRQATISRKVLDSLSLSVSGNYPRLVDFAEGRYCLAAPSQQAVLDRALAVLAAHPEGIDWDRLAAADDSRLWGDAVVWHLYGAGLARYRDEVLFPAEPGEQESLMLPAARRAARAMTPEALPVP
jgi:hypothetical protein